VLSAEPAAPPEAKVSVIMRKAAISGCKEKFHATGNFNRSHKRHFAHSMLWLTG
jgi:hypothetical protein